MTANEPTRRWRAPDLVIALRVTLAFVAIGCFSLPFPFAAVGCALTLAVISMDALDGYLARRLQMTSELGGVLDITGDRIVEHVFWIYFAVVQRVPLWVPLVIVTRSFVVDSVRGLALARGMTAFGDRTMMRSRASRFLAASRFMRTGYGAAKTAVFLVLGVLIVVQPTTSAGPPPVPAAVVSALEQVGFALVLVTVALNLARGAPVVWDARPYLAHERPTGT